MRFVGIERKNIVTSLKRYAGTENADDNSQTSG